MKNSKSNIQDNKNNRNFIERIISREGMTAKEFNDFMKLSLEQAENGESISVDEAFRELCKELLNEKNSKLLCSIEKKKI